MARTRVCVHGVRTVEDALAAAEGGADAVGFLFIPGSARLIRAAAAWEVVQALPPFVSTVGVFSNASVDQFCSTEVACPTDVSQLHGEEDEETVRQCGPRVIKTVKASASIEAEVARWMEIDEVDAVMVANAPGSGVPWSGVADAVQHAAKPVLIGGGLTAANVAEAVRAVRPWAVVVRESVEAGGQIDQELVEQFVEAVRGA